MKVILGEVDGDMVLEQRLRRTRNNVGVTFECVDRCKCLTEMALVQWCCGASSFLQMHLLTGMY